MEILEIIVFVRIVCQEFVVMPIEIKLQKSVFFNYDKNKLNKSKKIDHARKRES